MSRRRNHILQITEEAIAAGQPLQVKMIRELRAKSRQAVTLFKAVFWVGIVIFNVALWAPLPYQISKTTLYVIAFCALAVAVVVPILGLRKHQMNLELLKVNKQNLKKKSVSEKGRVYMDKVNFQERPFINAEFELLNGSKWPDRQERED